MNQSNASSCHITANSRPSHIFGADAALSYDPPDAQELNCRARGVGDFWKSLRVCVGGRAVFVVSHQLQGEGGQVEMLPCAVGSLVSSWRAGAIN